MSSKRKLRSENTRESRKRQATEENDVISLLTPEKAPNNTDAQDLEIIDNAKNNTTNNENNSHKTEQENSNKKEEDPQCGICLDKPTVQGKLDSCTHIFCFECIEHWSKTANTCPFCKARFKQLTKVDLLNPDNNKKMKKVRVRHADQRPEYDDPEEWIVYEDDDEFDDEDGWIEDDISAWGPWSAPQSLPGNFWTQFLAGSLPEAFEADVDEFIDDGPDDFIDLTDEPDEDLFDYEDEPNDDQDIGSIDISALVREVFHPYSRLAAPATSRRRSTSSRIRTLQNQMRSTRSSQNANNSNNTNNRNNSNNNNNRSSSTERSSGAISGRTRSHSASNSTNRTSRSNSSNQRNNTSNRRS